MSITIAGADMPKFPFYPIGGSFTPYSDANGYVNPFFNLGDISFGQGFSLPLILNFSSALRSPSLEFGQGWECPLFDAKIFDVQKDLKKVELLGGRELFLVYNQRIDRWKHYYSDHWTGQSKGLDFELSYDSQYKFTFHSGLISSVVLPGGRTIIWNRDSSGRLISLGEDGKLPALKLIYNKLGLAQRVLLNPDSMGASGKSYEFSPDLVYAGIQKISGLGGRTITISRNRGKDNNPLLAWTDTEGVPETLTWDRVTGKLTSDNDYTYQMKEFTDDKTYPRMTRRNKATGKTESFWFDQKHGVSELTRADGTVRHIETIQAASPNYKEIRLIEETKGGKTKTILHRSFDDKGHLVLEAIGLANGKEEVKQYVYDNAGRVISYIWNGKEMWKNTYDPATGMLLARELPTLGTKILFDQLPGGQVRESIQRPGGLATSTAMLAPAAYEAKVSSLERIQ